MIRLKKLKNKEYNPKFEELFYFLYSVDIDYIMDFERFEKDGKLNVDIGINDMKERIRLTQLSKDYTIIVDYVERNEDGECIYQKVEFFTFKTIALLVAKLKELLKKLSNIILVEYDKRPYKSIYNLLEYTKMDMIADDSSWITKGIEELSLTLADEKLNRIIFVSHDKKNNFDHYEISYHDYLEDEKEDGNIPYYEYFKKFRFKNEEEMCEKLKELIEPCLRKRRVHSIGHKYNSVRKELAK